MRESNKERYAIFFFCGLLIVASLQMIFCIIASAYPSSWTSEVKVNPSGSRARHLDIALRGSQIVLVCDNHASSQGNIQAFGSTDSGMTWSTLSLALDAEASRNASDPYVACANYEIVVAWKELINGKWAMVTRNSTNGGSSWYSPVVFSGNYNNYEPHIALTSQNTLYSCYVSDRTGRNEIYFRKRDKSGAWGAEICLSNGSDSTAASYPAIEFDPSSESKVSVYYENGNGSPREIMQVWSTDAGNTWHGPNNVSQSTLEDSRFPEVSHTAGGRTHLVFVEKCQDNSFRSYYRFYDAKLGGWSGKEQLNNTASIIPYPQIASYGSLVFMTYTASGNGRAESNSSHGDLDRWSDEGNVFHGNQPYDIAGSTSVLTCSSGTYLAEVNSNGAAYFKMRDNTPPSVSFTSPAAGSFKKADFTVEVNAQDNWNVSGSGLMSPNSQAYQKGVLDGTIYYRPSSGGSWAEIPGGGKIADSPWKKTFKVSTISDGKYDLMATMRDTAENSGSCQLKNIIIDRVAPSTNADIKGTVGNNGWFTTQPSVTLSGTDSLSGVAATYYKIDSGSWTSYSNSFKIGEGSHTLQFYSADKAGNSETAKSKTIKVDSKAPSSAVSSPKNDDVFNKDFTIKATASDATSGVAKVDLLFDGNLIRSFSSPPYEWTLSTADYEDGTHRISVKAYDKAGNSSESSKVNVLIDREPPESVAKLNGTEGMNGYFRSDVLVELHSEDSTSGVSGIHYRTSGDNWSGYIEPFSLGNGIHELEFYASDRAGNHEPPKKMTIRIDGENPSCKISNPTGTQLFSDSMKVKASASDKISGIDTMTLLIDGKIAAVSKSKSLEKTVYMEGYDDGVHNLRVAASDKAGNAFMCDPVDFVVDRTPPSVQIMNPKARDKLRGMVDFSVAADDANGISKVSFYIDGDMLFEDTEAPYETSFDSNKFSNGNHCLSASAVDKAGNLSKTEQLSKIEISIENQVNSAWYFAEGCTREGFETWLCIQNPQEKGNTVDIVYMLESGANIRQTVNTGARSRTTIFVNDIIGPGHDVSIALYSEMPVVAERPVYFNYRNKWLGGHTSIGSAKPFREWYFAEGCTREGFETWLCIQNPDNSNASLSVKYMTESGDVIDRRYIVSPHSRFTIEVAAEVGPGRDVSMLINSDCPVIAERPVYFNYQGLWDGGHNVVGVPEPSSVWYFAEGCTRTSFAEWICLFNPASEKADVKVRYMTEDGGITEKTHTVPAQTRYTINVNTDVARFHDVSTHIISSVPVVAERPMYFNFENRINEGSCAVGSSSPHCSWNLAEGCTRDGFTEWLCIFNPSEKSAEIEVRYMLESGENIERNYSIKPHTRFTVRVNDEVGPNKDVSLSVNCSVPCIVERPMYCIYKGFCPAADTAGGCVFD